MPYVAKHRRRRRVRPSVVAVAGLTAAGSLAQGATVPVPVSVRQVALGDVVPTPFAAAPVTAPLAAPPLAQPGGPLLLPAAVTLSLPATPPRGPLPAAARDAYVAAARTLGDCRLPWEVLAGVGYVASGHTAATGPRLDGRDGVTYLDSDRGRVDGDRRYDRPVGPMAIVPWVWQRWGADGDHDGVRDPRDFADAALTAGRYLCAAGAPLDRPDDLDRALAAYDRSPGFARAVLAAVETYRAS